MTSSKLKIKKHIFFRFNKKATISKNRLPLEDFLVCIFSVRIFLRSQDSDSNTRENLLINSEVNAEYKKLQINQK
jgi:hypothetical protein